MVLMCKTCGALWNRDENSSRNIYKIAKKIITNGERPNYLKRQNSYNTKKSISDATSVGKLKCPISRVTQLQFTRQESVKPC